MIIATADTSGAVKRMQEQVEKILNNTAVEHAYDHFPVYADGSAPTLPYIVWSYDESVFWADDMPWFTHYTITFDLYETERDDETERTIETALETFYVTKTADFDVNENIYIVSYTFDIG